MAERSPSPVNTTTLRSGFAILTPVANASALPWVVCKESVVIYPGARDEHPIPETKTVSSISHPISSTAFTVQFITVPLPHPAQKIWGSLSCRYHFSKMAEVIVLPPRRHRVQQVCESTRQSLAWRAPFVRSCGGQPHVPSGRGLIRAR